MSKRLAMLEKLTTAVQVDSFTWYALALEYRSVDRPDDAVATFTKLRELEPTYVPMYLMAGQVLMEGSRFSEARAWVEEGKKQAEAKGDTHAAGELAALLEEIGKDR